MHVTEDDSLGYCHGFVEIAKGAQLPFLLLDGDVELLDTLERQLVSLNKDPDRVTHEFLVTSSTSTGIVAESRTNWVTSGRS